jgi:GDP-D-mannose dehydratase
VKLGWERTVDFKGLVKMMVDSDMESLERQLKHGIILRPEKT